MYGAFRFVDPGRVDLDPDPSFKKKPGSDSEPITSFLSIYLIY